MIIKRCDHNGRVGRALAGNPPQNSIAQEPPGGSASSSWPVRAAPGRPTKRRTDRVAKAALPAIAPTEPKDSQRNVLDMERDPIVVASIKEPKK